MKQHNASSLTDFDTLPDSARVRLPVVAALFGVSAPTVWRWSRNGTIPSPIKVGGTTSWSVADLRRIKATAGVPA
jgi:predicted DNA-binding transcriptional regulator AlpA